VIKFKQIANHKPKGLSVGLLAIVLFVLDLALGSVPDDLEFATSAGEKAALPSPATEKPAKQTESALIPSMGKTIKLTYSNFFPVSYPHSTLVQSWCKEVEKRTSGSVKIDVLHGGTLTPAAQCYDGVVKGTSDIGMCSMAYTSPKFPLSGVIQLPLGYKSGLAATELANVLQRGLRPTEFDDVKVMYLHSSGPSFLHSRRTVRSLEDVKSMKVRAVGITSNVAKSLGASPVVFHMNEVNLALETGFADGIICSWEVLRTWNIGESIKYTIDCRSIAQSSLFFSVMNKRKWDELPKEVQNVIENVNQEWIEKTGRQWDALDKEGKEYSLSKGNKLLALSEPESRRWAEAVKPILDEYVNSMRAKGLPGQEALDFCLDQLKRIQQE